MRIKWLWCFFMMILISSPVGAQESDQRESDESGYYGRGKQAFDNHDYVTALKYLFAYKVSNSDQLDKNPEFLAVVDGAIELSEERLRNALNVFERITAHIHQDGTSVAIAAEWSSPSPEEYAPMLWASEELLDKQIELKRLELEALQLKLKLSDKEPEKSGEELIPY